MIHQIFWPFDDKALCDIPSFANNVNETQKFCKENNYEYKLWHLKDCEKLIEEDFPEYLELWNDFRYPIQRCDFIRYCILYKFGGLYLDCDIRPVKNLDAVFNDPLYFVHWADDDNRKIYNAIIGSVKNQKIFLDFMIECKRSFYEKSKNKTYDTWKGRFIFQTTGHYMLERVIKKNKINKDKYFHNVLFVKNTNKKYKDKSNSVGNPNTALFYDNNASVWCDNLI
jgi:mannosyltransferase OCH1-like enzyme